MISMSRQDRNTVLKAIIGIAIAAVVAFIVIVSVVVSLVINQQFYDNQLGLNWWNYLTMNNSAILLVPMITILVLVCVVSILNPLTSSTLTLVYNAFRRGQRPSRIKCLIWNYALVAGVGGLAMGWVIGFLFDGGFGIFVANHVNLSYEFFPTLFTALGYPLNPGTMDINVLFAYTFIIRPYIVLVMGALIAKLALDVFNAVAFRRRHGTNPLKAVGSIALIISLALFIGWLYLPNAAYDVIESSVVTSVIVGFFSSLVIGALFYILGVLNPEKYRGDKFYKSFMALAIIIIIILPIGFLISAGVKGLYYEANWNEWVWDTKLTTQISETRTAAGLDDFTELTTQELITNQSLSGTTDQEIIPHIRTFDLEASRASMENQIGSNWEVLADSDIIYLNGSEYWTAPRKIQSNDELGLTWVQDHIIYTHSRGFVALNPVTGDLIDNALFPSVFGVPYNYSIYFGELPDNGYTILNVTQYEEIGNITYSGSADVTLDGFLNWWYIEDWGFKTGESTGYLIKRNINDRIGGILLPNMVMGDDPYLVFDTANNRMHYCMDIILAFPSFSGYIDSSVVRWLGVVLVDVALGTMNFYQYNDTADNLPYEFLQIYMDKYPWQPMPVWLIDQLKYPEILAEYQLEVDYTYHVTDRATWKNEEDFFIRPEEADLYYIIYDVGYGLSYVGASIVEFEGAAVGNLVGFYVIENGKIPDRLGTTTFYRNGTVGQTQMIGLTAAESAYKQADAAFLQLLALKRFGNILIYPLAHSLYYVLPIYEISGENIQTLKRIALVNAFDPGIIGIGDNTTAAYAALNVTVTIPPGILSLNIMEAPAIVYEGVYEDLELLVNNGYASQGFNVSIEISTQYSLLNVSFGGQEITPVVGGGFYNYSVANLTLLPTQYTGVIPKLSGLVTGGQPYSPVNYVVNLYNDTGTLIDSHQRTLSIYP